MTFNISAQPSARTFGKTLRASAFALVATASMALHSGHASAQTVDESKYKPVTQEFAVTTGDKIEVAELFWFGCGHCFALEPALKKWEEDIPANASFKKIPAVFGAAWEFHAQAFYTMQALRVPQEAYDKFFNQIHVERKQIGNLSRLKDFLKAYGKNSEAVDSAFNSFDVDAKVRTAKKVSRQSGARGVPAIVVDGKYLTNQQMTGGTDQMFQTVNKLVKKAASER